MLHWIRTAAPLATLFFMSARGTIAAPFGSDETMPSSIGSRDPLTQLRAWQRFHVKLISLYGGTVLVALVVLAAIFYVTETNARLSDLQQRLLALVTSLAQSVPAQELLATPIDTAEPTALHTMLLKKFADVAAHESDVESIYILRPTNEPTKLRFFVDYSKHVKISKPGEFYDAADLPVMLKGFSQPAVEDQPYTDPFGTTLSGYAPIISADGASVGIVGADVRAVDLDRLRQTILYSVLMVFGAAALLIGLVSFSVARSVREPLDRIIQALSAVQRGELATRLALRRTDEFGLVGRHFDSMVEGLQERDFLRDTFGRYVGNSVAQLLLQHRDQITLGGEERVVTVLMSDLRAYSLISEWLAPPKVMEMLNTYLGEMTAIIDEHHGCVIEFLGDAILAVFGAPFYVADHAERAARCAVAMHRRLLVLNQTWEASGLADHWKDSGVERIRMGIGLHSGSVIAGNIGSATHMKYTIVGETVNVTARLEALNKTLDTEILLSAEVYAHLPAEITRHLEAKGEHKVQGRDWPLRVFAFTDLAAQDADIPRASPL
jgi:adenylate cyclase